MRKHFLTEVGKPSVTRALDRIHNVFHGTIVDINEKDHNTKIYWYVDATKVVEEVQIDMYNSDLSPTKWHYEWPEWYKEDEPFEFWKGVGTNDS